MSRTLTHPPQDKTMWRKLLHRCHPDAGGDHDLFIWADALREHVAGELPPPQGSRSATTSQRTGAEEPTRVVFHDAFDKASSFGDLTRQAVALAAHVGEPYGRLLLLLSDCAEAAEDEQPAYRQQHQGATYKQLAYVAHLAGLDRGQRTRWYKVCE